MKSVITFPYFSTIFAVMKWFLLSAFLFVLNHLNAQFVYLNAAAPFKIINSNSTKAFTSVWIELKSAEIPAQIDLQNGKILQRKFNNGIEKPYYVITNEKVRYRPNQNLVQADTVKLSTPAQLAVVEKDTLLKNDWEVVEYSHFETVKKQVLATKYEFEKTELLKFEIGRSHFTCSEIKGLLKLLEYDASRVEVLNASTAVITHDCRAELKLTVSESYRNQIK